MTTEPLQLHKFKSGATRNTDTNKIDYEGCLHPIVIKRFGEYMHKHRRMEDGSFRDSDNWQKGIPQDELIKSAFRHFMDWWLAHRGESNRDGVEDALCGLIFNAMGYLLEVKKRQIHDERQQSNNKSE